MGRGAAPSNQPAYQSLEINDFSPGIHAETSSNIPLGAGHPDGTFGCFWGDGALQPFPRVNQTIPGPTSILPTIGDALDAEFTINGTFAAGPITASPLSKATSGSEENNTELILGTIYGTESAGIVTVHTGIYRYRRNWISPEWDTITELSHTQGAYSGANFYNISMVSIRSNHDDDHLAGPVVVAFCDQNGNIFQFPDETAGNEGLDTIVHLPSDLYTDGTQGPSSGPSNLIVAHQGRIVTFMQSVTGFGTNAFYDTNEQFFWSNVNDIRTPAPTFSGGGANYYQVNIGYEHPTGYGVLTSNTSDELLLIKRWGGAYVVRGDLNDFQAVNYPYVRSVGDCRNNGTRTPKGYLYVVDGSGAWLWEGGQTAEHISPHLEDMFWRPPSILATDPDHTVLDIKGYFTSCDWLDRFAFLPNNWVWNTVPEYPPGSQSAGDMGTWWRLEDPDDFIIHRWTTDPFGVMIYGSPSGFATSQDPAFYEYDIRQPARTTYSFLTHPLFDPSSEIFVRYVTLAMSGQGGCTVTCFSAEDPIGQSQTFQATIGSDSRPTAQRLAFGVQGTHIQFQLDAFSPDDEGDIPAVHIHRMRVEYNESNLITMESGD